MKVKSRQKANVLEEIFHFHALPDTGASKSVISYDLAKANQIKIEENRRIPLHACNNSDLQCIGAADVVVDQNGHNTEIEVLVAKNMKNEFLIGWRDLIKMGIIHENFPCSVRSVSCPVCKPIGYQHHISATLPDPELVKLFEEFADVFNSEGELRAMVRPPMHITLKKNVKIIPTKVLTGRRIPFNLVKKADEEIEALVSSGVLQEAPEPTEWISPSMFVPKPNSTALRLVTDFRNLNQYVERPVQPFPTASEIVSCIPDGTKCFLKLDAVKGYFQIPLDEESMALTSFLIPGKAVYQYRRAPMGLNASGDEYCKRGDAALAGISNIKKIVDDILIFGQNRKSVLDTARQVLRRCREHGITLSKKKAEFGSCVKFAGYVISTQGVAPDPEKLSALRNFPTPKNLTDVRSFLGLANQLGSFIPDLAHVSKDLRMLLKKDVSWLWLPAHDVAFQKTKEALLQHAVLSHFNNDAYVELLTDASRLNGIGYALIQRDRDDRIRLVQCGSRSLTTSETRYATIELELLAAVWAIRKCRYYLAARMFTLVVDHRPLVGVFHKDSLDAIDNRRILSLLDKIAGYTFTVQWVPGKNHCIADALSRAPVFQPSEEDEDDIKVDIYRVLTRSSTNVRLKRLSEVAAHDKEYQQIIEVWKKASHPSSLAVTHPAKQYASIWENISLDVSGLLLFNDRIIVPRDCRKEILEALHIAHTGISKTRKNAKQLYYWPGLNEEIRKKLVNCDECQRLRASQSKERFITTSATRPLEKMSADLFQSGGKHYLVLVDRYSGYPFVNQLQRLDTQSIWNHLMSTWYLTGFPKSLRTDGGPQFRGPFLQLCTQYGITHELSSAYHPESNGHAEAAVKNMKYLLQKYDHVWKKFQPALLEWRNTPRSGSEHSPAQLMFGRRQQTMLPMTDEAQARSDVTLGKNSHASQSPQLPVEGNSQETLVLNSKEKNYRVLQIGEKVRIQNAVTKRWDGIGTILEIRDNNRSYLVQDNFDDSHILRNRIFLKPF